MLLWECKCFSLSHSDRLPLSLSRVGNNFVLNWLDAGRPVEWLVGVVKLNTHTAIL